MEIGRADQAVAARPLLSSAVVLLRNSLSMMQPRVTMCARSGHLAQYLGEAATPSCNLVASQRRRKKESRACLRFRPSAKRF